jgi:hypothetical protein
LVILPDLAEGFPPPIFSLLASRRRDNMGGNEREYGDLVVLMERPPIPELR